MSRPSSNLRVFVRFEEDPVFAGEEIECTITFKNLEASKGISQYAKLPREENGWPRGVDPLEQLRAARAPTQSASTGGVPVTARSQSKPVQSWRPQHRHTSSLSIVESAGKQHSAEGPGGGFHIADLGPKRKHGRTLSIVSLGGTAGQQRNPMHHGRSASIHNSPNALSPVGGRFPLSTLPSGLCGK